MIEFENFKQGVKMTWFDNQLKIHREIKFYGSNTPETTRAITEAFRFELNKMRSKHPQLTKEILENWLSEIQDRAVQGDFSQCTRLQNEA